MTKELEKKDHVSKSLLKELKADLKANGCTNRKPLTALRIIVLGAGFHTLFLYRILVRLRKIPFVWSTLGRVLYYLTKIITSCEISSTAKLEGGVSLPHPNGIVIGKGSVVKSGTTIYQHVTIGTRGGDLAETVFPFIGENVTIFTGAVIAGGCKIGDNAVIGANAVVLKDVPNGATAVGVPARIIPATTKS